MKGDSYHPFRVIKKNDNNGFPEISYSKFKPLKIIQVPEFLWENIKKKLEKKIQNNDVTKSFLSIFPGLFVGSLLNIICIENKSTMTNIIFWCVFTSSLIGSIFYFYVCKTASKTIEAKLDEVLESINMVEELHVHNKQTDETSANNEAS